MKKSFSDWVDSRPSDLQKAGDAYENLGDLAKGCINYAVKEYTREMAALFCDWFSFKQHPEYLEEKLSKLTIEENYDYWYKYVFYAKK